MSLGGGKRTFPTFVIPAKGGGSEPSWNWVPAFAGMTRMGSGEKMSVVGC